MMRPRLALVVVSLLVLAVGCGPKGLRSPLEPLDRAVAAVERGADGADELALAAWHAWLVEGDGALARQRATLAIDDDERHPWARLALAELEARAAEPEAEAGHLLALLEGDARGPLAEIAARRLRSLAGTSRALDREIVERFAAVLEDGEASGEVAAEMRASLVDIEKRRDPEAALVWAGRAGRVSEATVVGPLSPHAYLELELRRPALESGPIEAAGSTLRFPTGEITLADFPREGDVYYALTVVTVPRRGTYLVRATTDRTTSVSLFLDGTPVIERRGFGGPEPTLRSSRVELDAGDHLLALRLGRGGGAGRVTVELAPADGSPSSLVFRGAAPGDRASRRGARILPAPPMGSDLDGVGILASWALGRLHAGRDPEAARLAVEAAMAELPTSGALLWRRARIQLSDPSLPERIRRERAASDLARAAEGEENLAALLELAALHRREGRWPEAEEVLARAEEAAPSSLAVAVERARFFRDRGFDGLFRAAAGELHARAPDRCDVLALAWTAASRARDAEGRERLATEGETCPGGRTRALGWARDAGDLRRARRIAEARAVLAPDAMETGFLLAELEHAAGASVRAAEILEATEARWPRAASLPRTRAQYLVAAGREDLAREARLRALELDGSDLGALRAEAFERRREILAERDPETFEAIRAFETRGKRYDAPGVILVDFVGVEVHADGSSVERTHVLAKILDKRGIDLLGEVNVPGDAEVLELRTIKADGTVLHPEFIAAKDSISFPGLEVGDYVEYQYLRTQGKRPPSLEGWATPRFFFASRDLPIVDSIFVVRVEKGMGLEVDAHQQPPRGEIVDEGTHLLFVAHGRDLPAFVPEPHAVSMAEVVPWVQVGSGAGERDWACHLADRLLGAAWRDREVERWAKRAAGLGTPTEKVERLWRRLMEEIEGDGSFEERASHVLARKRGNRAVLLKAALDALGIENAWVSLRPYDRNPNPHRFPAPSQLSKLVLVARPDPTGGWLWLDPSVRHAPLGAVSPEAQGVPGYVLGSGPGADACVPTVSPLEVKTGRVLDYRLRIHDDGSIEGEVTEAFEGFAAAHARHAFERLDRERLEQVVESALARELFGAELVDVEVRTEGEEAFVRYAFRHESAVRPIGDGRALLELEFLRMHLARRYLTGAERRTPLLLGREERLRVDAEIVLPPGWTIERSPAAARELSSHGSFRRTVGERDGTLAIRDVLEIHRGRVLPHAYPEFAAWLTAIDRSLSEDLVLRPGPSGEEAEGDLGMEIEAPVGAGDEIPAPND